MGGLHSRRATTVVHRRPLWPPDEPIVGHVVAASVFSNSDLVRPSPPSYRAALLPRPSCGGPPELHGLCGGERFGANGLCGGERLGMDGFAVVSDRGRITGGVGVATALTSFSFSPPTLCSATPAFVRFESFLLASKRLFSTSVLSKCQI